MKDTITELNKSRIEIKNYSKIKLEINDIIGRHD